MIILKPTIIPYSCFVTRQLKLQTSNIKEIVKVSLALVPFNGPRDFLVSRDSEHNPFRVIQLVCATS